MLWNINLLVRVLECLHALNFGNFVILRYTFVRHSAIVHKSFSIKSNAPDMLKMTRNFSEILVPRECCYIT